MEPRITYIRNRKNFPVACLAFIFDKENHTITYGFAVHNPKDHFDRKIAIDLAKQRLYNALNQGDCHDNILDGMIKLNEHTTSSGGAITALLRMVKEADDVPLLLRSAASQYLRHKKAA